MAFGDFWGHGANPNSLRAFASTKHSPLIGRDASQPGQWATSVISTQKCPKRVDNPVGVAYIYICLGSRIELQGTGPGHCRQPQVPVSGHVRIRHSFVACLAPAEETQACTRTQDNLGCTQVGLAGSIQGCRPPGGTSYQTSVP